MSDPTSMPIQNEQIYFSYTHEAETDDDIDEIGDFTLNIRPDTNLHNLKEKIAATIAPILHINPKELENRMVITGNGEILDSTCDTIAKLRSHPGCLGAGADILNQLEVEILPGPDSTISGSSTPISPPTTP